MGGILPEIVELAAPPRDEGNVVGPGRDFVERLLVGLEGGIAQGGPGHRCGPDPAERLLLLDILEPEIGSGCSGIRSAMASVRSVRDCGRARIGDRDYRSGGPTATLARTQRIAIR